MGLSEVLNAQSRTFLEFGASYALNTSGDIQSVVIRNQFRQNITNRIQLIVELHILDGSFDWLGLNFYKGEKPFLFVDKYGSFPLGFRPGPNDVSGIKSLEPRTNRSTFYTFDLDGAYQIVKRPNISILIAGGPTIIHASQSGIWEVGDGILRTPFYGEVELLYTAPGNYRYIDLGANGQIQFNFHLSEKFTFGTRVALHATSKAGIFYIDYGLLIGAQL